MFGFLKKSVGVHIRDNEIVAVQLAKKTKVPKLGKVLRIALPEGTVKDGAILNEAILTEKLKELAGQIDLSNCNFALPIAKCFSAVLTFPSGVKDNMIEQSIGEKAAGVLPASVEKLYLEKKIIRKGKGEEVFVFLSGVEKSLINVYLKMFKAAGVKEPAYVLETLALARAIPVKLKEYSTLMFAHAFEDGVLLSSVYDGCLFDAFFAKDLRVDFAELYTAFYAQVKVLLSHVIVSGAPKLLSELSKVQFNGQKPEFVSAEFMVNLDGSDQVQNDLIVATGLSLLGMGGKKDGARLINLIN